MSLPYTSTEKLAGLFLIIGFLLFMIALVFVGGGRNWFRSHNNYYALYREGYNLSPGVKVKFLRTDIGYVTRLELTENNMVRVHMKILETYADRIRTDSKAAIESPTIIGSEFIDIIPGSADAPLIPAGGQIPSRERKSLNDMLADLRLQEKLQIVEDIMRNVESLTAQLKNPNGPLLGTMSNVQKVTDQVAQGQGSLGAIISREDLYVSISSFLDELNKTSRNLSGTSSAINKAIPDILSKTEDIITMWEAASRRAPDISRQANEGLRDVNQILDSAKRNFLIRGNLPPQEQPNSLGIPVSGN